eukprot:2783001-Ditylum_brightwellii.AAC.3
MALPHGTDRNQYVTINQALPDVIHPHCSTKQKRCTMHRAEEIQHRINILGWSRLRYLEKLGQSRVGLLK